MKRGRIYVTILALVILAFGLFRWQRGNPPPEKVEGTAETQGTHRGTIVPDDGTALDGGTPPLYLTLEQQLNPVHGPVRSDTPEERMALQKGARAKFTVCVVDSTRTPVPGATVEVGFYPHDYTVRDSNLAVSDGDGLCAFEGMTTAYVYLKAGKEGYYTTERRHYFYVMCTDCVKDGKWQPWGATLELVMKEIRSPAPLYVKYPRSITFPKKGVPCGFDCVAGDLVGPDGAGKTADLIFTFNGEKRAPLDFNYELRVRTANGGGLIRGRLDKWSELKSPHAAPETGYETEMVFRFNRPKDKVRGDSILGDDEYLLFETYSRGEQPCVGKLYGGMLFGEDYDSPERWGTGFLYFFNPVPGDRRLESDPERNLFGRGDMNVLRQP